MPDALRALTHLERELLTELVDGGGPRWRSPRDLARKLEQDPAAVWTALRQLRKRELTTGYLGVAGWQYAATDYAHQALADRQLRLA